MGGPPARSGSRRTAGVVRRSGIQRGTCRHTPGDGALSPDKLDAGYGARIAAGYCWPWSDPRPDGSLEPDVIIGDWARPWNLKGERAIGGAPPSALWATDPAGFGQVECVYTAQGFEYDWNGVIIGPDLVWRGNDWAIMRSANKDLDFLEPDEGLRTRVRTADPQRLQGPAHSRHGRHHHLLTRSRKLATYFAP